MKFSTYNRECLIDQKEKSPNIIGSTNTKRKKYKTKKNCEPVDSCKCPPQIRENYNLQEIIFKHKFSIFNFQVEEIA